MLHRRLQYRLIRRRFFKIPARLRRGRAHKHRLRLLGELAGAKEKWDRVEPAFRDCEAKGYGIVLPDASELRLEDPKIVKQSGGYGVRLRAAARSIHLISADVETEINPVVGTEE